MLIVVQDSATDRSEIKFKYSVGKMTQILILTVVTERRDIGIEELEEHVSFTFKAGIISSSSIAR